MLYCPIFQIDLGSYPARIDVALLFLGWLDQGIAEVLRHGLQSVCLLTDHGSSPEIIHSGNA